MMTVTWYRLSLWENTMTWSIFFVTVPSDSRIHRVCWMKTRHALLLLLPLLIPTPTISTVFILHHHPLLPHAQIMSPENNHLSPTEEVTTHPKENPQDTCPLSAKVRDPNMIITNSHDNNKSNGKRETNNYNSYWWLISNNSKRFKIQSIVIVLAPLFEL